MRNRLAVALIGLCCASAGAGEKTPPSRQHGRNVRGLYLPKAVRAQVQDSPACPNDICPGLGNGFYLPPPTPARSTPAGRSSSSTARSGIVRCCPR